VETVEDVVVLIRTDTGNTGYEALATAVITGDTHGSIIEAIRHFIAPRLIGQEVVNLNRLCGLVQTAMERNTSAKAAVEIAVRPVGAAARCTAVPDARWRRPGDHHRHHHQRGLHRQDGGRFAVGDRTRLRVAEDQGRQGHRPDIERVKAIHAAVEGRALLRWMPTRAGPPSRRCMRCVHWKKPAWYWSCWSSR
jgi:hypothetical protein